MAEHAQFRRPRAEAHGLARFARARRGNVAILTALVMTPLLLAAGMAIDYTLAARRQDKIQGYADAAILAGLTPTMLQGASSASAAASLAMFEGQLTTMTDVTWSASSISVQATDTTSGTTVKRSITITWSAASQNVFSSLLGLDTIALSGTSVASAGSAPNTDFYMLLDTSPSMGIAATTSGIDTMVSNTASQGGCAFACHESDPSSDSLGNPNGEDNYTLARALGVTLRIDLVNTATQNLMTYAANMATTNDTTYRVAIYTMDYSVNALQTLTSNLTAAEAAAANIQQVEVYNNNCLTASNCNQDEDSALDTGVYTLNALMPTPGNGTNDTGDTPKEVLFIVSDGLVDESYEGGARTIAPINTLVDNCTTVKARGIKIAFLYLTYNPLTTNAFYENTVASFQSSIATDAEACATSGLYFQVSTDGDVSSAMTTLFQKAIDAARLTQ